jgi:regulator of RNase E activity RraB
MILPPADPVRLRQESEADEDVLRSLSENGDQADLSRLIDVSFRGAEEALNDLEEAAEELGFVVIEREASEDGDLFLFLGREQPADPDSIKALTATCLGIETAFGVEYDGWGCVAQSGTAN